MPEAATFTLSSAASSSKHHAAPGCTLVVWWLWSGSITLPDHADQVAPMAAPVEHVSPGEVVARYEDKPPTLLAHFLASATTPSIGSDINRLENRFIRFM